jgi:ribosome maturation factor RimP
VKILRKPSSQLQAKKIFPFVAIIIHLPRTKETVEGNGKRSLLYFTYMNLEQKTDSIRQLIEEIISADADCFLVDVKLKPGNNIQVFVDADAGLPISRCIAYNRALYKQIEEKALFNEGDFALEVSSPGLEEPLKLVRQYSKNIGRLVEIVMKDGRKVLGKLQSATAEQVALEETKGKGKKQEVIQHNLAYADIKSTKIQIVFN